MKNLLLFLIVLPLYLLLDCFCKANEMVETKLSKLSEDGLLRLMAMNEEKLDLFCLLESYPQIERVEREPDGKIWLIMRNGEKVRYSLYDWEKNTLENASGPNVLDDDATSVAATMAEPYPLEPERPDRLAGNSPGRKRSRAFLQALYGHTRSEIMNRVVSTRFGGKSLQLSPAPALAFSKTAPKMEHLLVENPALKPYLKPDGWYYWRKIAGENRLSPHAYGIALDFGAKVAPYWRWTKIMPHPDQKTYSPQIVQAMEESGFIWGGKWHEYDLMHFEYRPELICKARIMSKYGK